MNLKRDRDSQAHFFTISAVLTIVLIASLGFTQCSRSERDKPPIGLQAGDIVTVHAAPEELLSFGGVAQSVEQDGKVVAAPPMLGIAVDQDNWEKLKAALEERDERKRMADSGLLIVSHTVIAVPNDARARVLKLENDGFEAELLEHADGTPADQHFWIPFRWVAKKP